MNVIYIIASLILAGILFSLYKQIMYLLSGINEFDNNSSKFVYVLAWIAGIFAALFGLFLVYWTINSWLIHIDPTKPKPHFIIVYILGLFTTGVLLSLSKYFYGIKKPDQHEH